MTHGWDGLPDDLYNTAPGAGTSLLVTTTHRETINAMPEMSAIPVRFERISATVNTYCKAASTSAP